MRTAHVRNLPLSKYCSAAANTRQLTSAKNKGFRLKPGSFERIFNAENDGTGGLVKLIVLKELSIKVSDKKK